MITLVGLLGTIIGLIKGFTAVAAVNPAEKAELLSASISIAMNNTAFALSVAIPFLLIHAFLQARTSENRRWPGGREDQLPQSGPAPEGRIGRREVSVMPRAPQSVLAARSRAAGTVARATRAYRAVHSSIQG